MKKILLAGLLLTGCAQNAVLEPSLADVHAKYLTLDTHLDTPMHFAREGWSFSDAHDMTNDVVQVDIPRMAAGNLDGGFFVIYTQQGPLTDEGYAAARDFALGRSDEIDAVIARYPDKIQPAKTAEDARRLDAEGKLIAFKSMENSYPLGKDLDMLREFYQRGVRMAGPVHSRNNQFADSSGDKPKWNGLSPLGREWVNEMNRLGMVIDASHSSDAAFDQMLALSKTPLILSHTSPKALSAQPRNLDDARIRKLAHAGGAICVSTVFLTPMNLSPEKTKAYNKLDNIADMAPADQAEFVQEWRALEQSEPLWPIDFERYMAAVLHVAETAGVDHTCFGADWDGGGGFPGFEDITALPKLTWRLKQAGYSDSDIEKMWSGNVLRLLEKAQAAREK